VHPGSVAVDLSSFLPFGGVICDWGVWVRWVFAVHVDSINTKAVDASLEPKDHGVVVDGLAGFFALPVEVRLLFAKEVEVVFLCRFIPLPGTASKVGPPVIRWLAVSFSIVLGRLPDVPIAPGVVFRRTRCLEPFMLVGSVVDNEVEDDTHAKSVGFSEQVLHVLDSTIWWIYVLVVADIVAHVNLRTVVHWADPYYVGTEGFDVVETLRDAADITDTITVRVFEASGVDLIDDTILPPGDMCDGHIETGVNRMRKEKGTSSGRDEGNVDNG